MNTLDMIPRLAGSSRVYSRASQSRTAIESLAPEDPDINVLDEFAVLITSKGQRFLVVLGALVGVENCQRPAVIAAASSRYQTLGPCKASHEDITKISRPIVAQLGFCGLTNTDDKRAWVLNTDYADYSNPEGLDAVMPDDHYYHVDVGFVFAV